ncbi:hypothetical protein ABFS82_09G070100 [Erythranthe guttata]
MGCNVSRLDGNGAATLPARQLRPLFLQRLDDFKAARRHGGGRPLKGAASTPSKKQLLFHIDDASRHSSINTNNTPKRMSIYNSLEDSIKKPDQKNREAINIYEKDIEMKKHIINVVDHEEEIVKGKGKNDMKEKTEDKIIEDDDFLSADEDINDGEEEDDDDDDNDDEDEGDERNIGFPGSPSFRVYFVDHDIGKIDAFKDAISSDDSVPSKESSSSSLSSSSSSEKKEKGARKKRSFRKVLPKNLLNVKSCYTCSHHKKQTPQLS